MRIKQDKPREALALLGPQLVPVGVLCELEKAARLLIDTALGVYSLVSR